MIEVKDQHRASHRVLLATLWLTLLVLAVEIWAGWAARSLSLLAEALHTLIDSFSALLSLMAVGNAYDANGQEIRSHGKRETVSVLLLVAFVGIVGFTLLEISARQLDAVMHKVALPFVAQINFPLIQLLCLVVAIYFCLVWFERYEARVLKSSALRLNAHHMLQDSWLTLLVLAGLIGIWQGYIWLDPLITVFLVLMSIKTLWRVLNWQLPSLVKQVAIAPEALSQLAHQVEGVTHCYRILSKGIVDRQVFIKMHLVVDPEFVEAAPAIADQVKQLLRERYGPVEAMIHIEKPSLSTESLADFASP
jgi:cation diffusion facilitator family transporter